MTRIYIFSSYLKIFPDGRAVPMLCSYESDLDREEAEERERELEEEAALEEELLRYPERRNFFSLEGDGVDSPTANWVGDNEWMDEYRKVTTSPHPLSLL